MIEKLIPDDSGGYTDNKGLFWKTKTEYLQHKIGFCGCGDPESAFVFLRDVLLAISKGPGHDDLRVLLPTDGIFYWVLYVLDHNRYTQHGGSVGGCWLTEKGESLLNDINWCLENENL